MLSVCISSWCNGSILMLSVSVSEPYDKLYAEYLHSLRGNLSTCSIAQNIYFCENWRDDLNFMSCCSLILVSKEIGQVPVCCLQFSWKKKHYDHTIPVHFNTRLLMSGSTRADRKTQPEPADCMGQSLRNYVA